VTPKEHYESHGEITSRDIEIGTSKCVSEIRREPPLTSCIELKQFTSIKYAALRIEETTDLPLSTVCVGETNNTCARCADRCYDETKCGYGASSNLALLRFRVLEASSRLQVPQNRLLQCFASCWLRFRQDNKNYSVDQLGETAAPSYPFARSLWSGFARGRKHAVLAPIPFVHNTTKSTSAVLRKVFCAPTKQHCRNACYQRCVG
jgi:hypothetical protein